MTDHPLDADEMGERVDRPGSAIVATADSSLAAILATAPYGSRVVAETVATCALAAFREEWPQDADAMAAVVCGRWIRTSMRVHHKRLSDRQASAIDRLINDCYMTLTDEQLAATERMYAEMDQQS